MGTSRNITRRLIGLSVFCCVLLFAFARPVFAQCYPAGSEFQVNTYIQNAQGYPSVAGLSGGGFVVTWHSNGQDVSNYGIYGQLFDSSGTKVGSEFRVNSYTTNNQVYPSVAGLSGGGFVVTWHSNGQDVSNFDVYGQLFESSGTKVGSEFGVNSYTTDNQVSPSVAGLAGCRFVVTWISYGQDGSAEGVYGQLFESSGTKVGSEFRVNSYTTSIQSNPLVAGLAGCRFVVTWISYGQDGSAEGIYGQVFDCSGTKVGSEFRVNSYTTYNQVYPSVAGLSGGGFVVTWHSYGQDGSNYGVYGQLFDSSGTKVGSEFGVNSYTTNNQGNSSVAGLSGGGFVVAWESDGQDGSGFGVYGQRFSFRNELVLNFGPTYGLYQYDQIGGYKQWNTVNPSQMVTVDLNGDGADELVAAFPDYGLYTYDSTNGWQLINTVIPDAIVRLGNGIAIDYGVAYGLWHWTQSGGWHSGWQQWSSVNPDRLLAVDVDNDGDEELVVSLNGYGLYGRDETFFWTQLSAVIPENMIRLNNGIVGDYGANGLGYWTPAAGWQQWSSVNPDKLLAVDVDNDGDEELVVSFNGYGLYWRDETFFWTQLSAVIPENMIRLNNGIVCDYGAAYGLWIWTQSGGWVQRNTVDPGQMTVVDIDNDSVGELVVSFSGYGLYYFDEINGWQQLNTVVPDDMKPINFYP